MLESWDFAKGNPPPPSSPSEMHTGTYPTPDFQTPFMAGFGNGYADGMQAGAIRLQMARNEAYSIALNEYYIKIRGDI